MLIAEGEDLYAKMQQHQPTMLHRQNLINLKEHEQHDKFWSEWVVNHFQFLERMLKEENMNFDTGYTAGELMLFAYIHQMYLVIHDIC